MLPPVCFPVVSGAADSAAEDSPPAAVVAADSAAGAPVVGAGVDFEHPANPVTAIAAAINSANDFFVFFIVILLYIFITAFAVISSYLS